MKQKRPAATFTSSRAAVPPKVKFSSAFIIISSAAR